MQANGQWRGFSVDRRDGGVCLVTLNDPDRLNAMTQGLKRDLVELLVQAQSDDDVRVLVITGSGRAFCAGDDVSGSYNAPEHAPSRSSLLPASGPEPVRGIPRCASSPRPSPGLCGTSTSPPSRP